MQVIFITGMSGAGKSQAVGCLEDIGYYCVDNMPPSLIQNFISLALNEKTGIDKVAFVVDIRGGEFLADAKESLSYLKDANVDCKILFLEASDEALVHRFKIGRAHV